MSKQVLTVSSLVRYLKNRLEGDSMTQHVLVEGELSNFSNYRSGHWYFTLKDSNAQLRCAMFASSNRKISYVPKDGDKVLVQGDISVFEGRGEMQLIVTNMKPSGIGDLFIQFDALKKNVAELVPKHITKEDILASINYNIHLEYGMVMMMISTIWVTDVSEP